MAATALLSVPNGHWNHLQNDLKLRFRDSILEKHLPFSCEKSICSQSLLVCGGLIGKFNFGVLRKAELGITVNRANGTEIGLQKMRSPFNPLLLCVSDDAEHRVLTPKGRLDSYPDKTPFRNKAYIDKRNWNSENISRPADACPKEHELGNEFIRWEVKVLLFHRTDVSSHAGLILTRKMPGTIK